MSTRSCATIVNGDRILLVRQIYKGETFWTFPGGSIEQNETPEQAAIREVKEESGVDIKIQHEILQVHSDRINGLYYCFLAVLMNGTPILGYDPELPEDQQELTDVRWVPIEQAKKLPEVERIISLLNP